MSHEQRIKECIVRIDCLNKAIGEPIPGIVDQDAFDAWRERVADSIRAVTALAIEVAQERHDCAAYLNLDQTPRPDRGADAGSVAGDQHRRRRPADAKRRER